MAKEIEVVINKDGSKVTLDAANFVGSSCHDFMGSIMKAIGDTEEIKRKPEFYKKEHQTIRA